MQVYSSYTETMRLLNKVIIIPIKESVLNFLFHKLYKLTKMNCTFEG